MRKISEKGCLEVVEAAGWRLGTNRGRKTPGTDAEADTVSKENEERELKKVKVYQYNLSKAYHQFDAPLKPTKNGNSNFNLICSDKTGKALMYSGKSTYSGKSGKVSGYYDNCYSSRFDKGEVGGAPIFIRSSRERSKLSLGTMNQMN